MTLTLNKLGLRKEFRLTAGCRAISPHLQSTVTPPCPGGLHQNSLGTAGTGKSPGYEARQSEAEILALPLATYVTFDQRHNHFYVSY